MTENDQMILTACFDRWFMGSVAASRLAALLTEVAHVCDDLIDRDEVVPPEVVQRTFRVLLLEIPSNVFYRANFEFLHPLLAQVWLQWTAANVMERERQSGDREKSYMLRAGLYGLYHGMAVVAGGIDWAESIGPEIYRTYVERLEDFDA